MKKLLLLLLFAGLLNTGSVFGWGREGHETIAKIAERNLTKKAKKRIEKYLGGHSIVYFAKWMDEYLERVKAMYYRSRNHSCVIAFALGGESGNGYNMYKAYEWLKSVEKSRPVICADADGEWNSDL